MPQLFIYNKFITFFPKLSGCTDVPRERIELSLICLHYLPERYARFPNPAVFHTFSKKYPSGKTLDFHGFCQRMSNSAAVKEIIYIHIGHAPCRFVDVQLSKI